MNAPSENPVIAPAGAPCKGAWRGIDLAYLDTELPQYTAGGQLLPPARAVLLSQKFIDRFQSRLTETAAPDYVPAELGPCLLWRGAVDKDGYGKVKLPASDTGVWLTRRAYQVAFLLHMRRWSAPGTILLHACDNPACCAPLHLREGTYSENNKEAWDKGRQPERKKPLGTARWRRGATPKMLAGGSPLTPSDAERAVSAIRGSEDPEGEALVMALDLKVSAKTLTDIARGRTHIASRQALRAEV